MRILLISPYFPPVANAESFCGGKFALGLADAGVETVVLYSSEYAVGGKCDRSLMWRPLDKQSLAIPNRRGNFLARCWKVLKFQTTAWTNWTNATVAKAMGLHGSRPFDVVISRALPWYAHIAGFWIATILKLPWLASLNDPWLSTPFHAPGFSSLEQTSSLNFKLWRRRVMARADVLTMPCTRLRDYTLRECRRNRRSFIVPHIGFAVGGRSSAGFCLVHAGKLGRNEPTGRSAKALLAGLAELMRSWPAIRAITRLVFVGPEDQGTAQYASELGLDEITHWTGKVSYECSLDYIAKAAVCILVEGNFEEGIFLPSKLCDYITARKPVLALSPAVGTVSDLAQEGGILRVNPGDTLGCANSLKVLADAFLQGRLTQYAPPESLVRRFQARAVVGSVLELVNQVRQPTAPIDIL